MTIVDSMYRSAHEKHLVTGVTQWGSLASVAQYRLPFAKTLAWLSPGDIVFAENWFFILRKTEQHPGWPPSAATPARDQLPS